jgi:hypothetical protein
LVKDFGEYLKKKKSRRKLSSEEKGEFLLQGKDFQSRRKCGIIRK